jgi:hypothetical protein
MGTCLPISRVNNVCSMALKPRTGLAVWTHAGTGADPTHGKPVKSLEKVERKGGDDL